jgi:hypothetical protein
MNVIAIKLLAVLALAGGLVAGYFGWHHHVFAQGEGTGRAAVQKDWNAETAARQKAEKAAVLQREQDNAAEVDKSRETNRLITKAHDAQILSLRNAIDAAPRMRVGPAFCGGLAGPADTNGTSGGNTANTGSRVLPEKVDGALKQLIVESEEAAATGRACQAFLRLNGFSR